jgi:outer membrane lipoprotein carrier protein
MTERYMRLPGLRPVALLAAGLLLACGGADLERDGAAGRATDGPTYGEAERTRPAMVAGPERDDTTRHDRAGDADERTTDEAGRQPGVTAPPRGPTADRPAPEPSAAAPHGEAAAPTDAILRATARTYERVGSLRAEFEQRMRNPLLGRETVSRGTLYQRQPDRFLMQFSDPDGDVIVSDGAHFWLYYPSVDARQVIRAPRGPQGLDLHAQFIGDPVTRFAATSEGRESVRGRVAHVLTLVPREPLGYRSLKVWIDADDHLVRRFELTEENGNVRRFELHDVVINPSLPDRLFQFTPPEGAQVIQRG